MKEQFDTIYSLAFCSTDPIFSKEGSKDPNQWFLNISKSLNKITSLTYQSKINKSLINKYLYIQKIKDMFLSSR